MKRRYSLRLRITAAFALLFAVGALVLMAVAYAIVAGSTGAPVSGSAVAGKTKFTPVAKAAAGNKHRPGIEPRAESISVRLGKHGETLVSLGTVQAAQADQSRSEHRQILWLFAAALVAVVALSLAGGWLAAGRALAPLRRITTTAREVSGDTLGARVALGGPPDELRELAETFDAMLARLDAAFVAQRRFVANASHELRTPLAVARTEAEVALDDERASAAELRDALEHVHATTLRAGDLVESLLTLARADAVPGDGEPVDLGLLVDEVVTENGAAAAAAGVQIEVTGSDAPELRVPGEETLLRVAVGNLLENAIAYNAKGGWVRATLRRRDGQLQLTVANSGPKVDPAMAEELFEPFVRADTSRSRRSGGAGLGLSIARAVVLAHRGTMGATAPACGGLEVAVSLPGVGALTRSSGQARFDPASAGRGS